MTEKNPDFGSFCFSSSEAVWWEIGWLRGGDRLAGGFQGWKLDGWSQLAGCHEGLQDGNWDG